MLFVIKILQKLRKIFDTNVALLCSTTDCHCLLHLLASSICDCWCAVHAGNPWKDNFGCWLFKRYHFGCQSNSLPIILSPKRNTLLLFCQDNVTYKSAHNINTTFSCLISRARESSPKCILFGQIIFLISLLNHKESMHFWIKHISSAQMLVEKKSHSFVSSKF